MPRFIDLTGYKFGRLEVLKRTNNKGSSTVWLCRCVCGSYKKIRADKLRTGTTTSCGCYHRELVSKRNFIHGFAKRGGRSVTHKVWSEMLDRCSRRTHISFKYYGGRGIKVCGRWKIFSNFLEDMGERPVGKSIDRKDNNKHYCKKNCRWATPTEQLRNYSRNVLLTLGGQTLCLAEWAEKTKHKIFYTSLALSGWLECRQILKGKDHGPHSSNPSPRQLDKGDPGLPSDLGTQVVVRRRVQTAGNDSDYKPTQLYKFVNNTLIVPAGFTPGLLICSGKLASPL